MKRPREPPTGGNKMNIGRILPTEEKNGGLRFVWSSKAFSNFANRVSVFQMSASCLFAKIVLKKVTANKEIVYN